MNILDWVDVGKVSAERDDLLSEYFFDNGVLKSVIESPSSFLVLGRKGAGKTAVFKHLSDNKNKFIGEDDMLIPLSFEDYNWNVHALLVDENKAQSLAYKQSWRFVILIECIKAFREWFIQHGKKVPEQLENANKLLEKLFDSPVPSISQLVGRKLLSLSGISLPKGGLDLEDGGLDSINVSGGNVSFDDVKKDRSLQQHLSENIENLIRYLDAVLTNIVSDCPNIYICFDRVDEAWDDVSYDSSKRVIAGLVSASDSITAQYNGLIRPIVFLREDIFDVLSINDANKLREDCGALLHWAKPSLANLMLRRINYYATSSGVDMVEDLDSMFDKKEMRQRTRPFNYLLKRTMMRPRDLISIMGKIIQTMREKADDPFADGKLTFEKLEAESIYSAEPGYSDWLKQEILDEWGVQKPVIVQLFNAIQNNASTNFTSDDLARELENLNIDANKSEVLSHIRFLFDNSIVGFKLGESKEWRFKCFYPAQGFLDSDEYRVHEGLVRALNLRENRDRD
ncbi:ATPase [Ketobacter sp. MCCC 1A13808]|uniref:P-loop ATPase, Sll1717 family n=1 Tax=Ketobacter sp. MCCC 1A13808 TaxID=2602738 RepID=UPI0012EB36D5|nr:ATPase [Ketobacter sp. MCCC 1A13808]MVF12260.1 ATPase [Ketobacter sp. MCCC 1A13808]